MLWFVLAMLLFAAMTPIGIAIGWAVTRIGKGFYFLVFVQLFEKYGTLIERNTALIERVSSFRRPGGEPVAGRVQCARRWHLLIRRDSRGYPRRTRAQLFRPRHEDYRTVRGRRAHGHARPLGMMFFSVQRLQLYGKHRAAMF
eukprot:SAG31_NODE_21_length_34109_cov_60.598824_13_plen_143_part_00